MDGESFKRDFILYDTSYQSVEVTGSWCDWQRGRHVLTKIPGLYFITSVDLPYGQKVLYKYIINGEWKTVDSEPTETGSDGLVNNVFQVPEQKALDGPVIGSTSNPREEPVTVGPPTSVPHGQNIVGSAEPMTENVEKVAPGVVEATPSGHGVSDRDLAKSDVGGATLESKHALANSAGTAKTDANAAHLSHSGVTGTESNVALVPNGSTAPGSASSNATNATGKPSYLGETREATPKAATGSYIAGSPASTLQGATSSLPSADKVAETASNAAGTAAAGIAAAAGAVAGGVVGAAAVATESARDAVASVQKSTSAPSTTAVRSSTSTTGTKAPLPAPTRDAPVAPGTHVQEGQGLFSAISHIASAATVAAQHAAERVVHAIEGDAHTTGTAASEGPRTATQTPAFGLQNAQASVPTVPSGTQVSSALKAHPAPTAQASSPKEPAAALAPIATNDGVSKITKEFGSVDLQHTKLEVTHAVESLGGAIAGALASIGASAEGRVSSIAPGSSAKINRAFSPTASSGIAPALSSSAAPVPAPVTATNTSTASDSSKPSYYGETREASPKAATGSYIGTGSSGANGAIAPSAVKELKQEIASEVKQTIPTAPATSTGTGLASASTAATDSNAATGASSAQAAAPAELKKEVASEVKQTVPTVAATSVGTATDSKSMTTPSSTIGKKEGSSFTDKLKRRVSKIDPSKDDSSKTTTTPPVPTTTGSAPSTPKKGSSTPSSRILPDNDKKLSTPTADLAKRGSAATASGVTGTAAADKTKPSTTSTAVPGAAKKETGSSLGVASGAGAASSLPPTTPKKSGVAEAGTPASAHTDGAYKTAPSTPATPADRKRKSSFFQKVKKAFSP